MTQTVLNINTVFVFSLFFLLLLFSLFFLFLNIKKSPFHEKVKIWGYNLVKTRVFSWLEFGVLIGSALIFDFVPKTSLTFQMIRSACVWLILAVVCFRVFVWTLGSPQHDAQTKNKKEKPFLKK